MYFLKLFLQAVAIPRHLENGRRGTSTRAFPCSAVLLTRISWEPSLQGEGFFAEPARVARYGGQLRRFGATYGRHRGGVPARRSRLPRARPGDRRRTRRPRGLRVARGLHSLGALRLLRRVALAYLRHRGRARGRSALPAPQATGPRRGLRGAARGRGRPPLLEGDGAAD